MKKVYPLERFWAKSEYHREKIKAVPDRNLKNLIHKTKS